MRSEKQAAVSAKINALRIAHGGSATHCPTCGRPNASPYRLVDERGRTIEGCIDAAHHGTQIGESARWHERSVAHAMRKAELARLFRAARSG